MTRDSPRDTERLRLRRLTLDDAALMLSIWNDPAFVRYVADRGIRTLDAAREALREGVLPQYASYGYGPYRLALRGSREPIGICGLFRREGFDDPDIGFALLPAYCGGGYAFEAAGAVVDYARNDLGIGRLLAIVSPANAASVRLIGKLGLRFERMHRMPGNDTDSAIYAAQLDETGVSDGPVR
jgi:RimJ/RimL family protein N-acetyltransferase